MKQINIDAMDTIVSELAAGKKLSAALKTVYSTRSLQIPMSYSDVDIRVKDMRMSNRTTNALLRAKLLTLTDVVRYTENNKLIDIKNMGTSCCIELMETIVDYLWNKMNKREKAEFLMQTVELNEFHLACYA